MSSDETSPGGSRIYRHDTVETQPTVIASTPYHGHIVDQLQVILGPSDGTFAETLSDTVKVDIIRFPPCETKPWWTLVTSGMSSRAMAVPDHVDDRDECRYAELMLSLPADWFPRSDWRDVTEDVWYPVRHLKKLARLPHKYGTWLWAGHTVPNGDPPQPIGPGTAMSGFLVTGSSMLDPQDDVVEISGGLIQPLSIIPLHADEMKFKLEQGSDALLKRLAEAEVNDVFNPRRPSVVARKKLFGLF